ncbi:MAG TPA: DUF3168 domain-containing protein [Hyphomicrobiaceae bacterium]|nr:DUF3168 domain-containing protein [Hyphomicrobiaceae bacterium]
MSNAAWALQKSVHDVLTADAALLALLGGPHVYDDVPRGTRLPYLTFGLSTERDWSTGGEEGSEHVLTLHVWSEAGGRKEAQQIIGAVRAVLHDAALTLAGHRLVNLRHELTDTRREPDGETYHGIIRLRAVTEPL